MKLPFWGTILTIIGVIVLCQLGFWQLARWQWKTEILEQLETEYAKDAHEVALTFDNPVAANQLVRGYVTGTYQHDKEMWIQTRTYDGIPGYHMLTPFVLENKKGVLLVNRGWIPIEQEMPKDGLIERSAGPVKIVGMVKSVPRANSFVPENRPTKNQWFRIDLAQMAQEKGIEQFIDNAVFYVEDEGRGEKGHYPFHVATLNKPNNNHAQYMVFWFTMAFLMVLIYVMRFIMPQKNASG